MPTRVHFRKFIALLPTPAQLFFFLGFSFDSVRTRSGHRPLAPVSESESLGTWTLERKQILPSVWCRNRIRS
ncbi:hypothetical protein K457DRAFT_443277 [Linnemannia elongata AG-77]|uniref:Uncharacterized protein n=1 Tax=Linnemannia elongata AG-77 TaxID=1314771 RepID=A0A197K103_9FUNG|nr:hypothetical protein K457DRAFT_443277 [Linnemannia elongata AG-77]